MNILRNPSVRLLLPLWFQTDGEGESMRKLFAAADIEKATEAELRALYGALVNGLMRWLVRASFENRN